MIRGDLCQMLHELASLPEKIVDPEWPDADVGFKIV
jgi:hypothetical protein